MSASFVGFTDSVPFHVGGDGLTLAVPAGVVAGDLLVCIQQSSLISPSVAPISCAGWTNYAANRAFNDCAIDLLVRIASNSEPASYTFVGYSSGIGIMLAYRGVVTGVPDDLDTTPFGGNSTVVPSLTPGALDDLLFYAATDDTDSYYLTATPPTGMTWRYRQDNVFHGAVLLIADELDYASTAPTGALAPGGTTPAHACGVGGLWLTALPYIQRNPAINHQNPAVV